MLQLGPISGTVIFVRQSASNHQEKATTIVFNQALSKSVQFKSEEDIKNHPATRKLLLENDLEVTATISFWFMRNTSFYKSEFENFASTL